MSNSVITKQALADALKTCMLTKALEKVSISEICSCCSLNRKSFYYHFRDKYALVLWIFNQEIGIEIKEQLDDHATYFLALNLCTYFEEHRLFYTNALADGGPGALRDHLVKELQPLVQRTLAIQPHSLMNLEGVSCMVSDFCISALNQWLRRMPPISAVQFLDELTSVVIMLTNRVKELLEPTPH